MTVKSEVDKDTVIISLTAGAFEEDRLKVIEHGSNDFVRKPFRRSEIFEIMQEYLGVRYVYEEGDVILNILKVTGRSTKISGRSLSASINDFL